jgi:hypothetical protein
VVFLEKYGTGPPNSTGAYELDYTLANEFDLAWRTMHVTSDVFVSPIHLGRVTINTYVLSVPPVSCCLIGPGGSYPWEAGQMLPPME